MKKVTVLFIQGGGEGAHEADKKLASSLEKSLGKNYHIEFPRISHEDNPEYKNFKIKIESSIKGIKGDLILVGHSVGACFLLKYITENKISKTVLGMFLIATPYWGKGGWNYEGFEIDNQAASKETKDIPTFFYQSTDDEIVPYSHLSLYEKDFRHAKIRSIEGRGHQLNNDLSEVVRDIEGLAW